jgi:hypothetical protein
MLHRSWVFCHQPPWVTVVVSLCGWTVVALGLRRSMVGGSIEFSRVVYLDMDGAFLGEVVARRN